MAEFFAAIDLGTIWIQLVIMTFFLGWIAAK
jgi:hypothetical protein